MSFRHQMVPSSILVQKFFLSLLSFSVLLFLTLALCMNLGERNPLLTFHILFWEYFFPTHRKTLSLPLHRVILFLTMTKFMGKIFREEDEGNGWGTNILHLISTVWIRTWFNLSSNSNFPLSSLQSSFASNPDFSVTNLNRLRFSSEKKRKRDR